jgi:hypothetical protein
VRKQARGGRPSAKKGNPTTTVASRRRAGKPRRTHSSSSSSSSSSRSSSDSDSDDSGFAGGGGGSSAAESRLEQLEAELRELEELASSAGGPSASGGGGQQSARDDERHRRRGGHRGGSRGDSFTAELAGTLDHEVTVTTVVQLASQGQLACGLASGVIEVWEVPDDAEPPPSGEAAGGSWVEGVHVDSIAAHSSGEPVVALAATGDGESCADAHAAAEQASLQLVASACADGELKLWDAATWEPLGVFRFPAHADVIVRAIAVFASAQAPPPLGGSVRGPSRARAARGCCDAAVTGDIASFRGTSWLGVPGGGLRRRHRQTVVTGAALRAAAAPPHYGGLRPAPVRLICMGVDDTPCCARRFPSARQRPRPTLRGVDTRADPQARERAARGARRRRGRRWR